MTLPDFADVFLSLSPPAYDAVNLDGGGATDEMCARCAEIHAGSRSEE